MKLFLGKKQIFIKEGEEVDLSDSKCYHKFRTLTTYMTEVLEQAVGLSEKTQDLELMKTNKLIETEEVPEIVTFSGGVADCIYKQYGDKLYFQDIGILLGEEIAASEKFKPYLKENVEETMRATVVGAGNYSMNVSGSTIEYQNCKFPIKNIPVVYIEMTEERIEGLEKQIREKVASVKEGEEQKQIALAAQGLQCPSFEQIEKIADEIVKAMEVEISDGQILLLVLEADMGKALGQALKRRMPRNKPVVCIDKIACKYGDYIDIGEPMASGKVLPVVVKTLIFQTEEGREQ